MKKVFTLAALLLVQSSYALQLEGTNGVEILVIDGKNVDSDIFKDSNKPEIEAGEHQIAVRFAKEFYIDQELRSRPHIFTIDVQQDTQISVDKFNTEYKAQAAINKGLEWHIISKDNQYSIKNSDVLIDNGFLPYYNMEKVVSSYNQQKIVSSVTHATNADATTNANLSSKQTENTAKSAMSSGSEFIKPLYNALSDADKKAFRMWLIEQEMK